MKTVEPVATAAIREAVTASIKQGSTDYGIPIPSLYELASRGTPGFLRLGRAVRIHRPTFERWLEEQARGPRNAT